MKTMIMIFMILFFWIPTTQGQKIKEWVNQKKTQAEYLVQQIAANQVYLQYVRKGYRIAKDGLGTISTFKNGEFKLHDAFFQSLKTVNPYIKNSPRVHDMVELQVSMAAERREITRQVSLSTAFSAAEVGYIQRVFGRSKNDSEAILDELIAVTSHGKLQMRDDERMERIDRLFFEMQHQYTFLQSFGTEIRLMAAARLQQENEIKTSHALHGITNQ